MPYPNIGLDPAFLAAYKSPNYYALANSSAQTTNPDSVVTANSDSTNVSFRQNPSTPSSATGGTSSDNTAAYCILSSVALIGAGLLCRKAYVKGDVAKEFFPRIGDGFKKMFDGVKKSFTNITNKSTKNQFTIAQQNGKNVCTIPGKRGQVIKASNIDELNALGINLQNTAITDPSTKITKFTANIKDDTGKIIGNITFVNGKPKLGTKELLSKYNNPTCDADKELIKQIDDFASKVMKKDSSVFTDDITNIAYHVTDGDVIYRYGQAKGSGNAELKNILTDKFALDSNAVSAYCAKNQKAGEIIKALKDGKTAEGLKITGGKYKTDDGIIYNIKNGEIVSIELPTGALPRTSAGTYRVGTDAFEAYKAQHTDYFENVFKNQDKWTDTISVLA